MVNPFVASALSRANTALDKANQALGSNVFPEVVLKTMPDQNMIKVYYNLAGGKYVAVEFLRDIDVSVNQDIWRTYRIYRSSYDEESFIDDTSEYFFYSGTEGDFVYYPTGKTWHGGGHGYEELTDFKLYLDGKLIDETAEGTHEGRDVRFIQVSNILDSENIETVESIHIKDFKVSKKGLERINRCTFQTDVDMAVFYGAKSSEQTSTTTFITSSYDYVEHDMVALDNDEQVQTGNAFKVWGRNPTTGMNYELEIEPKEIIEGQSTFIWKTNNFNSFYFKYYPDGTLINAGKETETKIHTFYSY